MNGNENGVALRTPVMRTGNGTAVWTPARPEPARDLEHLQEIVVDTEQYPGPVRAIGSRHSLNECAVTAGTAVSMQEGFGIDYVPTEEPAPGTITVGAGARLIELAQTLKGRGLQLEVMPEIGNATAGSVACCGTKDSSIRPRGLGQVSSTVVKLKMVNADGCSVTVTDDSTPSLSDVRCSYGLLGIVYEVTFATRPLESLEFSYRIFDVSPQDAPPALDTVLGGPDNGFLGFLLPYQHKLLVERRRPLDRYVEPSLRGRISRWLRTFLWESGGSWGTSMVHHNWWFDICDHVILWLFHCSGLIDKFRACRAETMIDFKEHRSHYFDFTFWALPASRWHTVIPAYLRWCDEYQCRTGFRSALPTEIYFIRKDQHSPLSFSFDEDIFTLDIVDSRPNLAEWHEMNRAFNEFMASHGGRPLLNQTKQLDPDLVCHQLDDDWRRAWKKLAEEASKSPRFLNPYFAHLLGLSVPSADGWRIPAYR